MTGWWFSPGTPVSSTNKTDCQDVTEILLKVELNTITLISNPQWGLLYILYYIFKPYGHKTNFEFCTHASKSSNQNNVFIGYETILFCPLLHDL